MRNYPKPTTRPARICLAALIALTSGCATVRFGREQNITTAEQSALTCEQIDLDIAKVDGFLIDTNHTNETSGGKHFLGFMADFGIGNHMEYNDAIESGNHRRDELLRLRDRKNCSGKAEVYPTLE